MNEPSPTVVAARSWLFVRQQHSMFSPGAYVRWRLRHWQQIAAGDIAYLVSALDGGLVGWALIHTGPGGKSPGRVHLQILGYVSTAITTAGIYESLDESQRTQGQLEISADRATDLDRVLEKAGVSTPGSHPEVVKFREELSARSQRRPDSAVEVGWAIGALAAVGGRGALVSDLIHLTTPEGENQFSDGARTSLTVACGFAHRNSLERRPVVDAVALVQSVLAHAKPHEVPNPRPTPGDLLLAALLKLAGFSRNTIPDLPTNVDEERIAAAVAAPELTAILADAAVLVQTTHPSQERVHLRHVVIALVLSEAGRRALNRYVLSQASPGDIFESISSAFRTYLRTESLGDDLGAWDLILDRFKGLTLPPPLQRHPVVIEHAAYAADRPSPLADDALDVAKDARAMAELICLDEAQPPLAIGLFGDWGSGKSTFMEMLREAIDETTARVAKQPALPFVDRVAHIQFNAWHYMDANLWASLVTHIFKELERQSRAPGAGHDWLQHEQFECLLKEFGVVKDAEREARTKLDQVNNQISATKRQLTRIDNARAAARKHLIKASLREALDKQQFGGPNTAIGNAAETIGLGSGPFTGRQLRDLIDDPSSLLTQFRLLATAARLGKYRCNWPLWLLLTFIVVPVAAAVIVAVEFPELQQLSASLVGVLGPVAGVIAWIVSFGSHLRTKLGPLLSQQQDLIRQYADRDAEQAKLEAEAKAALEDLHVQQQQTERDLEDKTREREHLEAMARGERPDELLERFIQTRAQTEDYRKHLGLLNSIRNDFDMMSKLMRSQRDKRREGEVPSPMLPSIDRIVLYIDDLDRCQDKQVEQVLEAVHLLLAFDLFVVVVGVDARWLHKALKRIYPGQLGTGGAGHASPADYLEKIFQIPFWLRTLNYGEQGTFGSLIDKLIGTDVEGTSPLPLAAPRTADDDESRAGAGNGAPPRDTVQGDDEVTTIIAPVTVTLPEETPEETLERVKVRKNEVAFMKMLGPLIGKSPRATKRFVNLYRLVRARKRGAELKTFLDGTADGPAQYPAAMVVLAIEVGLPPSLAATIFDRIRAPDDDGSIATVLADNEAWGSKLANATAQFSEKTGSDIRRRDVAAILSEIARYSFSRPM